MLTSARLPIVVPTLFAALALSLSAGMSDAPAASAASRATTLKIGTRNADITKLDLGAKGDSAGDLVIFRSTVLPTADRLGTLFGTSVRLRSPAAGPQTSSFTDTFQLPGGQIVVGGYARAVTAPGGLPRGVAHTQAVLGGTGVYLGARGTMSQVRHADGTYGERFTLKRPAARPVRKISYTRDSRADRNLFLDLGAPGSSIGDMTIFDGLLHVGSATGHVDGLTTVVTSDSRSNTGQAQLTFRLPGGSILVGGVTAQHTDNDGLSPGPSAARPVLGGTGRYAGVGGSFLVTTSADGKMYGGSFALVGALPAKPRTLRFVARPPTRKTIDIGAPGKSPGDLYITSGSLADARNKKRIGMLHGTQTSIVLDGNVETVQTFFTFSFRDGDVVVGGLSQYPRNGLGNIVGKRYERAVLGGTGHYAGAHGTLTSTRRPNGTYEQILRYAR